MKLIWHVAKNDLRQLRSPIVIYAILIATKLLLGVWLIRGSTINLGVFAQAQILGNLCIGLEVLLGYVVVAAFVHEHPLVGTRAAWQTRPISGTQLLIAKLLGLGLVTIVLPLLVSLPWWISHGYTALDLQQAALETLLRQAVVLVPALALAVLTDGFDRYVVWLLVIFGVAYVTSKLPPVKAAISTAEVALTRQWLALGAGVVTALLVVLNQFLTRRTGRGVVLLSGGLIVTGFAAWWWPYSFDRFEPTPVATSEETVPSSEIRLVFERARIVTRGEHDPQLRVGVAVLGVPDGLKLQSGSVQQRWSWQEAKIERAGELNEENFGVTAPALRALGLVPPRVDEAWFQANAERPVRIGMLGQPILPEGLGITVHAPMRHSYLAWIKRETPRYDLTAELELFRPDVIAEEPLVVGARLDRRDKHIRIARLAQAGQLLRVTLVEYSPAVTWSNPGQYVGTRLGELSPNSEYFLVNRQRGNASRGEEILVQRARFGTVGITWRTLQFSAPKEWISGSWVELPGWFHTLTLAKLTNRRVAEVRRELHVEDFKIEP